MRLFKDGRLLYSGSAHDLLRAAPSPEAAESAYTKLRQSMPNVSSGTLRKWKKLMDLKYGVEMPF